MTDGVPTGRAAPLLSRRRAAALLVVLTGLCGLAAALPMLRASAPAPIDPALAAQFCAQAPVEAHATVTEPADRRYAVEVPVANREFGQAADRSFSIVQGDVVRFTVSSPRPGMVAVHGLMDVVPVQVDGVVTVAFRALYSGRFPLHFHGADGSHFEIVALDVMPRGAKTAPPAVAKVGDPGS